jgi:hypothetical protein
MPEKEAEAQVAVTFVVVFVIFVVFFIVYVFRLFTCPGCHRQFCQAGPLGFREIGQASSSKKRQKWSNTFLLISLDSLPASLEVWLILYPGEGIQHSSPVFSSSIMVKV